MPAKKRIGKARGLDDDKRQQLLEGPDAVLLAGAGYLDRLDVGSFGLAPAEDQAAVLAEMREDWATFGPDLMAWWRSGEGASGVKPWAWVSAGGYDRDPWALCEFGAPWEA